MKYLKIILALVLVINLANADQVKTNFDPTANGTVYFDAGTFYLNSVLLEISTTVAATCRYSYDSNKAYGSMEETFDYNFEYIHKKTLEELDEGLYKYYMQCISINGSILPSKLEIVFKVETPITAQIILQENPPLKAGQYEITLLTSEVPLQKPSLTYSLDGIVYNPVPLAGAEMVWKGFIVIPQSVGETVGSFKFSGKDLSGKTGEEITKNAVFIIDTKKPATITTLESSGLLGEIKLDWYIEEEISEFNIYRSTEPGVTYTNYFKISEDSSFIDTDVESGETYYYRIASVDAAGNIGDLSREIYSTVPLTNNSKQTNTGLKLEYRGRVDNLLVEINLLKENVNEIQEKFVSKNEKEKNVFYALDLNKELESVIVELNSLARDVEGYKSQDLSQEELDRKLNAGSVKIGIIKKKIPENVFIREEKIGSRNSNEEDISNALFSLAPDASQKVVENTIKKTNELSKERNFKNNYEGYNIEVVYLDGARKDFTYIVEKIDSSLDKLDSASIILTVPKTFVESTTEMKIKTPGYEMLGESVLRFESDVRSIAYILPKKINLGDLENERVTLVYLAEEKTNSLFTGEVILGIDKSTFKSPLAIVFFLLCIAAGYFIFSKIALRKKFTTKIDEMFKEIEELLAKGDKKTANEKYISLKEKYKSFSKKEQEIIYGRAKKLNEEIQKK